MNKSSVSSRGINVKSAIVGGSNGFIGSHLCNNLLNNGYKVYGLYHEKNKLPEKEHFETIHFDINNLDDLDLPKTTYFFNCVWSGMNGKDRANVEIQLNNATNVKKLLLFADQIGCSRFINCGSIMEDEAYVSCSNAYAQAQPSYIYGMAKLLSHYLCKSASKEIEYVSAKLTNVYGPGEKSPRLINSLIRSHFQGKRFGLTPGMQYYDFIYIDEAIEAIRLIAEKGKNNKSYIVSKGDPDHLCNHLKKLERMLNSPFFGYGDIDYNGPMLDKSYFDITDLITDTGYRPKINFEEGCSILIPLIEKEVEIEKNNYSIIN